MMTSAQMKLVRGPEPTREEWDQIRFEQTGLRVIARGKEAEALWLKHGGHCGNDDPDCILLVDTDRYAPDLPRGTWLMSCTYGLGGHEGDLCYVWSRDGDELTFGYLQYENPGESYIAPDDPLKVTRCSMDDTQEFRGLLLFDANGRAYRPANRYARRGYELMEQGK